MPETKKFLFLDNLPLHLLVKLITNGVGDRNSSEKEARKANRMMRGCELELEKRFHQANIVFRSQWTLISPISYVLLTWFLLYMHCRFGLFLLINGTLREVGGWRLFWWVTREMWVLTGWGSHSVLVSPSGDLLEEVSRVSLGPCQIRDQPPASLLELPLFFKKKNELFQLRLPGKTFRKWLHFGFFVCLFLLSLKFQFFAWRTRWWWTPSRCVFLVVAVHVP